jgi:hypothetical protein
MIRCVYFSSFIFFSFPYNLRTSDRALCVVWTTPLVATLGMSLTIPLAMVADMFIHGRHYSAIYILGSAQVCHPSFWKMPFLLFASN